MFRKTNTPRPTAGRRAGLVGKKTRSLWYRQAPRYQRMAEWVPAKDGARAKSRACMELKINIGSPSGIKDRTGLLPCLAPMPHSSRSQLSSCNFRGWLPLPQLLLTHGHLDRAVLSGLQAASTPSRRHARCHPWARGPPRSSQWPQTRRRSQRETVLARALKMLEPEAGGRRVR